MHKQHGKVTIFSFTEDEVKTALMAYADGMTEGYMPIVDEFSLKVTEDQSGCIDACLTCHYLEAE